MRAGNVAWAIVTLVLLGSASVVRAQAQTQDNNEEMVEQVRALRELVFKQQEQINQLSGLPKSGEPQMTADEQRRFILDSIKAEMKDQKLPDWITNSTIKGDFRYRTEYIKMQQTLSQKQGSRSGVPAIERAARVPDRTRQRIRARVGYFTKVNDEVDVGIQLATGGNGDPVSTNLTLGGDGWGSFQKKPVWFDLAYADYHPKWLPDFHLIMGRIPNPFYQVGNSDLNWDHDLRFDGMAGTWLHKFNDRVKLNVAGGNFWIAERNARPSEDTTLWGIQGYVTVDMPDITKGMYTKAGLSYYDYSNVQYEALNTFFSGTGAGNTFGPVNPNGAIVNGYWSDYNIINPFVEVGFDDPWWHRPLAFFADFAVNPVARSRNNPLLANTTGAFPNLGGMRGDVDNDFAWLVGVKYGKCKNPGDWEVAYNFRSVQPDAVIGDFTDSDFIGGGTDGWGSKIAVTYQVARNFQAACTYFNNEVQANDYYRDGRDYQRLQLDLIFKF